MATPRIKLQETSAYFNKLTILIKTKLDINKEEKNETKFTQSQKQLALRDRRSNKGENQTGREKNCKITKKIEYGLMLLRLPRCGQYVGREEIRAPLKTPAWEARQYATC